MNHEIKKRLDGIGNKEAILLFFKLISQMIAALKLDADNEKLAINVRNDYRKRISVNLNSHLVLSIKDGDEFGFKINEEDVASIENQMPLISKEIFKALKLPASFIKINYKDVIVHLDLIISLWIKSCTIYEPMIAKSRYRKHNIPELYDLALDEILLNKYLDDAPNSSNSFKDIINDLAIYLKAEDNILSDFEINKEFFTEKYAWLNDSQKIIGNLTAHYEIISRYNKLYTCIHFENKLQQHQEIFKSIIGEVLPANIIWFDWQLSQSLQFKNSLNYNDPDILKKLASQLLYLEENMGDIVRNILQKHFTPLNTINKMTLPLNQILFGPPGTGKTYNTINKALEIIGEKITEKTRAEIKNLFDARTKDGQIVFTTFHQSMSYEDFIEGIKPLKPSTNGNIGYDIKDGIFKQISVKAFSSLLPKETKTIDFETPSFDQLYVEFLEVIKPFIGKDDFSFKTITNSELKLVDIKETSLIVKFKWRDTAHTILATQPFSITKEKIKLLFEAALIPSEIKNLKESITPYIKNNIPMYFAVYRYFYDFAKEKIGEKQIKEIVTTDEMGFQELYENWSMIPDEDRKVAIETCPKYVLIIDEINRGNISQIFGELITLIEDNKRLGKDEALEVILPYSKEKFAVPPNLYIIGTMNTADRSVEALDAALRRRFCFEEMSPKPALITPLETLRRFWINAIGKYGGSIESYNDYEKEIRAMLGIKIHNVDKYIEYGDGEESKFSSVEFEDRLKDIISFDGINLSTMLTTINKRIEKLLDKDHQIGHSYFMAVYSMSDLKVAFQNKIIPLLQEYFFGDYSKIGLVLGQGFVSLKPWDKNDDSFANFPSESIGDFDEREVYELIDYTNTNTNYSIKFNQGQAEKSVQMNFEKAINLLMNKLID